MRTGRHRQIRDRRRPLRSTGRLLAVAGPWRAPLPIALLALIGLLAGGVGVAGLKFRTTASSAITITAQYLVDTSTWQPASTPSATTVPALNQQQDSSHWTFQVDGTGFSANQVATVTLSGDATDSATAPVDNQGDFTATLTLTTFPCGPGTVTAGDENNENAQAAVDLICPQLHAVASGATVSVHGLGFPVPGDPFLPGASGFGAWIEPTGTSPTGSPTAIGNVGTSGELSFVIGADCTTTDYTITAKTALGTDFGDPSASTDVTVFCGGTISVQQSYVGKSGLQVNLDDNPYTVTGSGFSTTQGIQLDVNGTPVGTLVTPDSNGNFSSTLDASSAFEPCSASGSASPDFFTVGAAQSGGASASVIINDVRCHALGARSDAFFGVGANGSPNPYGFVAFPGRPYTFEITPLSMRVSSPITAAMDGTTIGASTTDEQGDADFNGTWQQATCGEHTLAVSQPSADGSGQVTASIPFFVTCLSATPNDVAPGEQIHLDGTNYEADSLVSIALDDPQNIIGTATVGDATDPAHLAGDFSADIDLPDSLPCGGHTIYAVEAPYLDGSITPGADYDPLGPHGTATVVDPCPPPPTTPPSPSPSPSPTPTLTPTPTPTPSLTPSPTPTPTTTSTPTPPRTPSPVPTPQPRPTPTSNATLAVSPGVADSGSLVTATGRHFTPRDHVVLVWQLPGRGGTTVSGEFTTMTDRHGGFRVLLPVTTDGVIGPLVLHAEDRHHRRAHTGLLAERGGWEPAGTDPVSLLPILFPPG